MDSNCVKPKPTHPRQTANFLSLITFYYTLRLFKKGLKKDLDADNLYDVLSNCKSKNLGDQLELQWELEKKNRTTPCFIRVLWKMFGKSYLMFGAVQLTTRIILILSVPEALSKVISYFNPNQTETTQEDVWYYATTAIVLLTCNFLYTQNYLLQLTEFAIKVRTAICSLLYRKALKMTEKSLADISVGKMVTLITKDVNAIETIVLYGNDIWIGLVQTGVVCFVIYRKIGVAAFTGVGIFFIILPLQVLISKLSTKFRLKTSKKTDERLQLTQEILSSIKTVKMYAWESFFCDKIKYMRRKELDSIFKLFLLKIIMIVTGVLCGRIAFYFLIMTHIWMGFYCTAELVYFIKICLHKLRHLFSVMLPLCLLFGAEFTATSMRIKTILNAEEVPTPNLTTSEICVSFLKVSLKSTESKLKNITLELHKGLNVVVGHVGSGKTTFVKTILQEFHVDGTLTITGTLSYASQEPWLFPGTIKHNILFGEKLSLERYKKVLEVCALDQDLKTFSDGDNTIIGDNGVNLSRGQQARVNLARAVYKDADIYVLDDCLASLDRDVSDYIFKTCLLEFLHDKLCVFVSNNDEYARASDWTISIANGDVLLVENPEKQKFDLVKNKEAAYMKSRRKSRKTGEEAQTKQLYHEENRTGHVDFNTYQKYICFGGGYIVFTMITVMFIIVQINISYSEQLVSNWVTLEQNLSTYHALKMTNSSSFVHQELERNDILNVFTIIIVASTGLSLIRSLSFFNFNRKASLNLHKAMLARILKSKVAFFDGHLIGNVLNRFSKDFSIVDDYLPFVMNECFEFLFILLGIIFLVSAVNYVFLVIAGLSFTIAFLARRVYLRTGRSLQRLESSIRSPLIGHLSTSLQGLTTIRAFKAQQIIKDEFDRHLDHYTSVNYTLHNTTRALAFVLDGISVGFITIVILWFLLVPDGTAVGNVGMAITQALHLTSLLEYGIKRWADMESQMTSVERILQYTQIEQEEQGGEVVPNWPHRGEVVYDDVSLVYHHRKVLKNVTFTAAPLQKIGIVGRTGGGKTSLISALFRLYDVEGTIKIDGVNTKEISLHFLRSNIAVIPQEPVLFSGTFRENLDPLNKYTDAEMWKILKNIDLEKHVGSLTDVVDKTKFSAGQKQLLCLARAIIRRSRIVVLDEATANLDNETDWLIQNVIHYNFTGCTLIMVAHRMSSILASDVVMVVDDGRIVEFDKPCRLLKNRKSLFFKMFK